MKGKTGESAMRGGEMARKGTGMALKGGGMARKGTGSKATPGGKTPKMAMGGTPPMMQRPGTPPPSMGRPGMPSPGMPKPGMGRPGFSVNVGGGNGSSIRPIRGLPIGTPTPAPGGGLTKPAPIGSKTPGQYQVGMPAPGYSLSGMKKGGKVAAYAKGGSVKMTAGAGSGSGRLEKVAAHKAAKRIPAANLKSGGKVKGK